MKFVKRVGVFETNSSSVHAIAIGTMYNDEKLPDHLDFYTGEFGWGKEEYKDIESRASYLFTGIWSNYYISDSDKKWYDENYPGEYEKRLNKYHDWIAYITNTLAKHNIDAEFHVPVPDPEWGYVDKGYVDHADELKEFLDALYNDENKLMQFLFSNDSEVRTGNDNGYDSEPDENFSSNISEVYWKFQ